MNPYPVTHTHTLTHSHTLTYTEYLHRHIHRDVHTHIQVHANTCTYICTHTHTHFPSTSKWCLRLLTDDWDWLKHLGPVSQLARQRPLWFTPLKTVVETPTLPNQRAIFQGRASCQPRGQCPVGSSASLLRKVFGLKSCLSVVLSSGFSPLFTRLPLTVFLCRGHLFWARILSFINWEMLYQGITKNFLWHHDCAFLKLNLRLQEEVKLPPEDPGTSVSFFSSHLVGHLPRSQAPSLRTRPVTVFNRWCRSHHHGPYRSLEAFLYFLTLFSLKWNYVLPFTITPGCLP